jgi:hypothetical protein
MGSAIKPDPEPRQQARPARIAEAETRRQQTNGASGAYDDPTDPLSGPLDVLPDSAAPHRTINPVSPDNLAAAREVDPPLALEGEQVGVWRDRAGAWHRFADEPPAFAGEVVETRQATT